MTRYTITFTGTVQGVGFRYTTVTIAQRFKVAGWVRNERDGSVRCVAEGDQTELDRFVAAVKQAMNRSITSARIDQSPATGEFARFDVRH